MRECQLHSSLRRSLLTCMCAHQKTSKLAAPDPFKSTSQSIKDGSRKIGENKLLSRPGSSKNRFQPYQGKCRDCKSTVTQNKAKYCHGCAYKRGVCAICGKKVLDTSGYVMSAK
ncbi:microtubule-associated protein CRIPT-domain-containing protein [Amylocystis lapponica]|nr:microtubule-associated protein CRIPT-domain-containing protein [Amylocystis lapponica]